MQNGWFLSQQSKKKWSKINIGIFTAMIFNAIFLLTRHSHDFQIIPWNWKHLTNRKVQGIKVFGHVILHSYLCNALCRFSSKSKAINAFPKQILKSKARDQSIQATKKSFCQVIVTNYLCNVLWKLLIKIESTWRHEIKEQAPQLT